MSDNKYDFYAVTESESFQDDALDETKRENVPRGPEVQFEVEEYDIDSLVPKLVEFEHEYGLSSIEMFSQYMRGMTDLDEEWLDLFLLYLGTPEVRRFSYP